MQCCVRSGAQSKSPVSVKVTDAGPYKRGESFCKLLYHKLQAAINASARRALDDLDKSSGMWPTMIGVMAEKCRKLAQDYGELQRLETELQKYEGEAISNGREDNI